MTRNRYGFLLLLAVILLSGCGEKEYQPPADAIPEIPPSRSKSGSDAGPVAAPKNK